MRRGLGKGLGSGYYNLMPMDSHIHSLSAKGVKSKNMIDPKTFGSQNKEYLKKIKMIQKYPYVKDVRNNKSYKRIKYGYAQGDIDEYCPDCGVGKGYYHHPSCDIERSPIPDERGMQLLSSERAGDFSMEAKGKMFTMYGSKWKVEEKGKETVLLSNRKGETLRITREEYEAYRPKTRPTGEVIEEVINAKGNKKDKIKKGIFTVAGLVAGAEATKGTGYEGAGALVGGYAGYKFAESLGGKGVRKGQMVAVWDFKLGKRVVGTFQGIDKKTGQTIVKIGKKTRKVFADMVSDVKIEDLKLYATGFQKPRGSIKLAVQQAITVPSTEFDKKISKAQFEKRVDDVQKWLSQTYGGETSIQGQGGYVSDTGKLIEEPVVVVTAFADTRTFNKKADNMVDKLNEWKSKWKQESIAYQVEDDLFLI